MFADSLLESAPYSGHRSAWTKLVSTLLQATALAIAIALPLFHIERLGFVPPPPSIQIGLLQQAAIVQPRSATMSSNVVAPVLPDLVRPTYIRQPLSAGRSQLNGPPTGFSLPCTINCSGIGLDNLVPPGTFPLPSPPNHEASLPPHISEMQLGALLHKVVPDYPTIAKRLGIQGAVILLATIGRDGRVEQVKPISGPPLLQNAARRAVEQWQYRPYILNHEPIEVQTQITVRFVLNRE